MGKNTFYRPDIDGLRAIAVLSVVFYHAGLGFPGGYVGVDVFFVISGYLITALIVKDLERGSFSMASFWERRIRRIFPALAVMVAVTCVAGWFLLLPEDLAKLGASVIAQALLVSNFYFWRTTNYFGGANEEKPLLHTWSLAVEEQFYLIFPIALMAFWWAWSRWQKVQADRRLKIEDREFGSAGGNQLADSMEFLEGQSQAGLQMDSQIPNSIRAANDSGTSGPNSSSVSIRDIRGSNSEGLDAGRVRQWNVQPVESEKITPPAKHIPTGSPLDASSIAPSPIGDQRRWALFWLFAAVAFVSLAISVWGVKSQPFATFFLLPTRAWELLLGSMLAVLPASVVVRNTALRETLCFVGFAGIFMPVFFYGEQTPFPGLAALPPCFGTASLIWANTPASSKPQRGRIAAALSWQPMVFVGLISYSLYLWHWPVICFSSYWAVAEFTAVEKSGIVVFSLALAVTSWKYVETPFRKKGNPFSKNTLMFGFVSLSFFLAAVGFFFDAEQGVSRRLPVEAQKFLKHIEMDSSERRKYANVAGNFDNLPGLAEKMIPRIGINRTTSPDFILLGDSHAQCMVPVFDEFAKMNNLSGVVVTHQGTPPFLEWDHYLEVAPNNPQEYFQKVYKYVAESRINNVFLLSYWSQYLKHGGEKDFQVAFEKSILALQDAGAKVWMILDYPSHESDPVRGVLRDTLFPRLSQFFPAHSAPSLKTHWMRNSKIKEIAEKMKIEIIDASKGLYDVEKNIFATVVTGIPLYFDKDHLTIFGAEKSLRIPLTLVFTKIQEKAAAASSSNSKKVSPNSNIE